MLMEKRIVYKQTQIISDDMDDEETKPDGLTSISLSRVSVIRRKRKRNDIDVDIDIDIDSVDGIRKKQSKGVKTVEEEVESVVDTISELPESVIHHILSFIRNAKEAARMSILSKKWKDAWKSFSILTFDEQNYLKTEVDLSSDKRRQMFIDLIDNSLLSHLARNLAIYKLVLRITPQLIPYLNRWLGMTGSGPRQRTIGLRELDIHVEDKTRKRYNSLLPLVMHSDSTKTLTALRLYGLNLSSFEGLKFNNLQKLHLRRLHVDQQIVQKLVSTSPLIMDLRILECRGLKKLKISGFPKLERVDVHRCQGLRRIELQVTSLQTFWYWGKKSSRCKLILESCTSLKRLTLEDPFMRDTFLNELLLRFPALEKLELSKCNKLFYIVISNAELRSLSLRSCNNLKLVDIACVNPYSLDYKGSRMAWILGRSRLKEANFSLDTREDGVADIPFRNPYLDSFIRNHCQGFKIIILFYKNVIIFDGSKDIVFPPRVPVFKIQVINSSTNATDLLDGLLTTWRPEKIIVVSSPSSDVPKALHEIKREENPSCCSYNSSNKKCWRHFLDDAKIVNMTETEGISSWFYDGMNFRGRVEQIIGMQLHWEPSVHFDKA